MKKIIALAVCLFASYAFAVLPPYYTQQDILKSIIDSDEVFKAFGSNSSLMINSIKERKDSNFEVGTDDGQCIVVAIDYEMIQGFAGAAMPLPKVDDSYVCGRAEAKPDLCKLADPDGMLDAKDVELIKNKNSIDLKIAGVKYIFDESNFSMSDYFYLDPKTNKVVLTVDYTFQSFRVLGCK